MPDGFLLIHPLPARFTDENGNRPHVVFKRTASLSPFLPDFQLATKVQEDPKIQMNPMKEEDHFCDVSKSYELADLIS